MPTDWEPWPGKTKATLFDMAAEYNDASKWLAARIQQHREHDSADRSVQMRIDDRIHRARERQRARGLFEAQLPHDENCEDPAVEVATPQVRDGARRHDAVQC